MWTFKFHFALKATFSIGFASGNRLPRLLSTELSRSLSGSGSLALADCFHQQTQFLLWHYYTLSSGNPRKFRHGIYLVYTWYILLAFVILVYTRYMTGICFLGKSIFVYHWMHVCMQWLLPKYTIHRALDGDLFSKSYIEFNISMVYDRHLLGIHLVYTTFVLVLILSE